jgi:L,D-peptidoglycan transpeptidase YkuD (ErfK/YbiS/YcfS/YnhG family)
MDLLVNSSGLAEWRGQKLRCAVGGSGISSAKREGDGATPAGSFAMRFVLFRPDRGSAPRTALPCRALDRRDGWCDDPADPLYNRLIQLPYTASSESLWRDDMLYDLIVPLGYNDLSVVPDRGSAIFLHLAAPDFAPTAGCVTLARADLLAVLAMADGGSRVVITP